MDNIAMITYKKKVAIQARSIGAGGIFHIFNKFTYKILNLEVPPPTFFWDHVKIIGKN